MSMPGFPRVAAESKGLPRESATERAAEATGTHLFSALEVEARSSCWHGWFHSGAALLSLASRWHLLLLRHLVSPLRVSVSQSLLFFFN